MKTATASIADPQACARATELLLARQIIVAPTDTVYGVMCRYDSAEAVARLYAVKDRPHQKAIPILISDFDQLKTVTKWPLSRLARDLMRCLWPGPLTLVLPARPHLPRVLTAGQQTVAVRMPNHDALRGLIRLAGPLAASSANLSGAPETHTIREVIAQLEGRIPLVLADEDDGRARAPASTIVDLGDGSTKEPTIVREGPVGDKVRALCTRAHQNQC
jgi:L-threonylcarbamoyladenylate synthase